MRLQRYDIFLNKQAPWRQLGLAKEVEAMGY